MAWDREYPGLREKLEQVRALGVKDALLGNLGMFPIARELGFTLRGDFGLEIYNAQALKEYKRLGLQSATLSFELKLAQIRDLSKCLDTELITYGRLPLMLMENCIIKNRTGSCGCQNTNILTDRKGARFPVVSAPGCRNELLNSQKLFLADKMCIRDSCLGSDGLLYAGKLRFRPLNADLRAALEPLAEQWEQEHKNGGDGSPASSICNRFIQYLDSLRIHPAGIGVPTR